MSRLGTSLSWLLFAFIVFHTIVNHLALGQQSEGDPTVVDQDLKAEKVGLKTDDAAVEREAQSIVEDGYSVAEQKLIQQTAEQFGYHADVTRLMDLIINSLYQNRDIFLRELISNASDALDKIRVKALTEPEEMGEKTELDIRISLDLENKLLHIQDSGIGMTREELIENLGTIARSGTSEFLKAMSDSQDSNLIGQFGVGFYSAFLVADTVTVTSKHNESDKQYVWQSDASQSFTVSEDPRGNTLGRGTRITLRLKEDAVEFLNPDRVKEIVAKYSEFITYPIYLWASHEEDAPKTEVEESTEEELEDEEAEEELEVEEEEEEKEDAGDEVKKVTVWDWERLNDKKPLWTRNPKDVTEEEYTDFYKATSKDYEAPLSHIHFTAEGEYEFKALLFLPARAPPMLHDPNAKLNNIKLYVRRVFVTDDFSQVLPRYLGFVTGIVDSDTLTINVSREVLQQSKTLKVIEKKLVRKAIAMFQKLATDEPEKYDKFWKAFGTNIKLGIIEDTHNRGRLSKLLRFYSSKAVDQPTSLKDYIGRMREGQKDIYFLAGEDQDKLSESPLVEKLLRKGYEVLYMVDPIDEYTMQALTKFEDYSLVNVAKEGLKLDDEEEEEQKAHEEEYEQLLDHLKAALAGKIDKAVVSTRLLTYPAILTSAAWGYTANQERIMRAQALGSDDPRMGYMKARKTLEINPKHPIIKDLNRRIQEGEDNSVISNVVSLLYDTAALQAGFSVEEPRSFVTSINRLLKLSLNIDPDAEVELHEEEEAVETDRNQADSAVEEIDDVVGEDFHDEL